MTALSVWGTVMVGASIVATALNTVARALRETRDELRKLNNFLNRNVRR